MVPTEEVQVLVDERREEGAPYSPISSFYRTLTSNRMPTTVGAFSVSINS